MNSKQPKRPLWASAGDGFPAPMMAGHMLNGDFQGFVDGIVGYFTGLVTTLTDLGSQIMNGLWSGLQSVWGSISSWISGVVNSITDWFSGIGAKIASFFGFDGDGDTDGSHASGLASVPYDGYRATLHRGETVLNPNDTAKLVELLQKGGGGGDDRPIQITTQVVLDGRIIGPERDEVSAQERKDGGSVKGLTLVANGQDLGKIAVSYKCYHEITHEKIITTQDGTEHAYGKKERPIVEFTLPLLPDSSSADYDALTKEPLMVTFDDPDIGILEREMRLDCNWEKEFEIHNCVDHASYYSSGTIRLRAKEVL